jgi:GntR family transcriptional repressor for pyruvate dehydrogenase complex
MSPLAEGELPLRRTLTDDLAAGVLDLIRADGLGSGDPLPAARDLARRFGVSTPTLREALRRLQATQAIEIRHGSGIYVGRNLERVVLPNPNAQSLTAERFHELLDARLVIEPELARRAAVHRTEAQLATLRERLAKAERTLDDDALLHEENMAFHRAVAAAAGNRVLSEVIDSLLAVHAAEQREILRIYDDRVRDLEEHRQILAALSAGNADDAYRLSRQHLEGVRSVIDVRLEPLEPHPTTRTGGIDR